MFGGVEVSWKFHPLVVISITLSGMASQITRVMLNYHMAGSIVSTTTKPTTR